jgi:ornithine cyclodeaminase
METTIISQKEVLTLLPMTECIEVMAAALVALAEGKVILPLRPVLWLPERVGALAMMPAYDGAAPAMGVKVISVFPGNRGTAFDSHQGVVLLFDSEHGRLLAIIDATAVTEIRTAAVSAVATRVLSRPDAGDLAILGSGTQARAHLEAMLAVRAIRRVRVWSRTPENAHRFAQAAAHSFAGPVEVMTTVEAAVDGADLICTTTSAQTPILQGDWISPGVHINAVGSSVPFARELDATAVARSRLFVDRRESALNESGDFLFAKQEGAIGDDHIRGELGELLLGRVVGRTAANEITLFKSLGLAIEDIAAAQYIYRQAQAQQVGTSLRLGGSRQ